MSILLDALRKSERSQKPIVTPDIHSSAPSDPASNPLNIWLLAILLVMALVTSGWIVWRQYQPETDAYQPPVSLPSEGVRTQTDDTDSPGGLTGNENASVEPAAATVPDINSLSRPRTPVETYQSSTGDSGSTDAISAASSGSGSAEQTQAKKWSSNTDDSYSDPTPVKQQNAPASNAKARAPESILSPPQIPAPIGFWELPDSVRDQVPEIKFSVLVYARDPSDRFVLINGERLSEGDTYMPGLIVEEIRRDGVIFSYRLYRFLIE